MIKPLNAIYLLVCCALISDCSSSVAPLQYHLLHSVQYQASAPLSASVRPVVQLSISSLPDYLKGKQMTHQTGPNTLTVSSINVWAEQPEQSVLRILSEQLRAQGWIVDTHHQTPHEYDVQVDIDDLISTWQGEVVFKGRFVVHRNAHSATPVNFDYRLKLAQDGYSHAVEKMRHSVTLLSEKMHQQLITYKP